MPAALLDTNAVSDLMRDHPKVKTRVGHHPNPVLTSASQTADHPSDKQRSLLLHRRQACQTTRIICSINAAVSDPLSSLFSSSWTATASTTSHRPARLRKALVFSKIQLRKASTSSSVQIACAKPLAES
jgi:hypothetical protein